MRGMTEKYQGGKKRRKQAFLFEKKCPQDKDQHTVQGINDYIGQMKTSGVALPQSIVHDKAHGHKWPVIEPASAPQDSMVFHGVDLCMYDARVIPDKGIPQARNIQQKREEKYYN